MAQPGETRSSPRGVTFTTANIADPNGIKTTIATAATAQDYTDTDLNGGVLTPAPDSKAGYTQWPSATASNAAGSYVNASTIRFTGTYKGVVTVRTATVAGTGGNATFIADGPLDGPVTRIQVAAQADTSGAWTFGWADLECVRRGNPNAQQEPWRECRGSTAANIGYMDSAGVDQYLPCIAGEHHSVLIPRLRTATTTVTLVTLYE